MKTFQRTKFNKKFHIIPPHVQVSSEDIISWSSLIAILVVIDLIWFVHRMAKTYSTAKMILYGCPAFVDCRKPGPGMFQVLCILLI